MENNNNKKIKNWMHFESLSTPFAVCARTHTLSHTMRSVCVCCACALHFIGKMHRFVVSMCFIHDYYIELRIIFWSLCICFRSKMFVIVVVIVVGIFISLTFWLTSASDEMQSSPLCVAGSRIVAVHSDEYNSRIKNGKRPYFTCSESDHFKLSILHVRSFFLFVSIFL